MKITRVSQRSPDLIVAGDIFDVEGSGHCVVVRIDNADTGLFTVLAANGDEITLNVCHPGETPTHAAPTTLQ